MKTPGRQELDAVGKSKIALGAGWLPVQLWFWEPLVGRCARRGKKQRNRLQRESPHPSHARASNAQLADPKD